MKEPSVVDATEVAFAHLENLATALRQPIDLAVARHGLELEANSDQLTAPDLAAAAAERVGMSVTRTSESLRSILARVRPGMPVLVASTAFSPGIVLLEANPTSAKIADETRPSGHQWIGWRGLAERLGLGSLDEEVFAWHFQSQLPLEELSAHEHGGHRTPLQRLLSLMSVERSDVTAVVIYAIGIGILTLATPLAVESLVNTIAFGGLIQPLVIVSLLLFASLAFAAVLRVMQTILVEFLQRRIFIRLVGDLSRRLPRVVVSVADRQHFPEIVNRFFDVVTVQKVGATFLLEGVSLILSTIIGATLLAMYHPYLLIYDVVLLFSMIVITYLLGRGATRTSIEESLAKYAVADALEEVARAPLAFKSSEGPTLAAQRTDTVARSYLAARAQHFRIVLRQVVFALALQAVASTILLGLGGWLVISGQLTLGQLVAAELIVTVVIGSFAKMGKHLESFYDLLAAMDKVGHLLDLPIEASGHEDLPETAKGFALALHGVSFAYDGMTEAIISDASLSIRAGGKVAVIGASGSGKSSLLDLLGGLRAPTAGTVTVEGVDLRVLRSESFRDSTIIVRDLDIVSGNILDNVRMGRNQISVQAVMATLADVGLDEELERLPEGVRTRLAPNGSPLSRGQALRLLLARAIVQPPRLLIIDGALDGLEAGVRQRMAALLAGLGDKTTVLIATQSGDIFEYFPQTLPMESLQQGYAAEQSSARFGDESV